MQRRAIGRQDHGMKHILPSDVSSMDSLGLGRQQIPVLAQARPESGRAYKLYDREKGPGASGEGLCLPLRASKRL